IARLRRGERIGHYETVRVAKDGRRIDISLTVSPLRDSAGNVVGASKVARDITERRQAEKLQRLLVDELNHRVKNTLATIQAIASQSLHRSKSPADFVATFSGRVQALSRVHDLLTQKRLQGAEIMGLVREQVLIGGADDNRVVCSGPMLVLDAQAAMHLALVLHELGTNARKYGALSVPDGRLAVSWAVRTNGGRNLFLQWEESGGPQGISPGVRGFGPALIAQTLAGPRRAAAGGQRRHCCAQPQPRGGAGRAAPAAAAAKAGGRRGARDRPGRDRAAGRAARIGAGGPSRQAHPGDRGRAAGIDGVGDDPV